MQQFIEWCISEFIHFRHDPLQTVCAFDPEQVLFAYLSNRDFQRTDDPIDLRIAEVILNVNLVDASGCVFNRSLTEFLPYKYFLLLSQLFLL